MGDFERVGLQPEGANLPSNDHIVVDRARRADTAKGERGNVERAQRTDIFDRMHTRRSLSEAAHQAIRRLDEDMSERRGDGARGMSDAPGSGFGSRELVTARSLDAGRRVEHVLLLVGRRDAALLTEMLEPRRVIASVQVDHTDPGNPKRTETERWRLVVALVTGERHVNSQGAVVRSACENLALAYREIDGATRRAS